MSVAAVAPLEFEQHSPIVQKRAVGTGRASAVGLQCALRIGLYLALPLAAPWRHGAGSNTTTCQQHDDPPASRRRVRPAQIWPLTVWYPSVRTQLSAMSARIRSPAMVASRVLRYLPGMADHKASAASITAAK